MELLGTRVDEVGRLGRGVAQVLGVDEGVEDLATEVDGHPHRSGDEVGGRRVERLATRGVVA